MTTEQLRKASDVEDALYRFKHHSQELEKNPDKVRLMFNEKGIDISGLPCFITVMQLIKQDIKSKVEELQKQFDEL